MNWAYLSVVLIGFLALASVGCSTPEPPPTFEILARKEEDRIVPEFAAGQVVFDVHSESGIGGAEVKLSSGRWPDKILIRLHLSGLENFKFAYPQTVVEVSVQSSGDRKVIRSAMKDGEDLPSAEEDTVFFMPVARDDQKGWIEVQSPANFHDRKPNGFRIDWIDFYR